MTTYRPLRPYRGCRPASPIALLFLKYRRRFSLDLARRRTVQAVKAYGWPVAVIATLVVIQGVR